MITKKGATALLIGLVLAWSLVACAENALEASAEELLGVADQAYAHGRIEEALAAYSEALTAYEELQRLAEEASSDPGRPVGEQIAEGVAARIYIYLRAVVLVSIADCHRERGDSFKAREYEEEAQGLMASIGMEQGLADVRSPWMLTMEADRHLTRGDYETAIDYAVRAYQIAMEKAATSQDTWWREYAAEALLIVAKSYGLLGFTDLASRALEDALSIAYELDDEPLRAAILALLGLSDLRSGQYFLAEISLLQALQIYSESRDDVGLAGSYLFLGLVKSAGGDDENAILCYEHSLAAGERAQLPELEADACRALAKLYWQRGDLDTAYEYLERGVALCERGNCLPLSLVATHHLIANYFQEIGASEDAVAHYRQAIQLVEATRCHLERSVMRTLHMSQYLTPYHGLVAALAEIGDHNGAFECAELAKARTLADMIETAMLRRGDILPPPVQSASIAYQALAAAQATASDPIPGTWSPEQRASIARVATDQAEGYSALLSQLEREYPELGGTLSLTPGRLSDQVDDVLSQLAEGTLVLEYLVMRDETILWVVMEDGIQTVSRIPISRTELAQHVQAFREEVNTAPLPGEGPTRLLRVREQGRDLYDLLVAPVEAYLEDADHLVIVPSDVLFYVPFGALYDCPDCVGRDLLGGEFLIERYSLSYAPSLSSLYWPFQHRGDGVYSSVLSVGNPTEDLEFAAEEARSIAQLFPQPTLLLEEQGTEAAVKEALQARRYDAVHLSTHGLFDPVLPLVSQLALREGSGEDGALYAGEILGLSLDCELVVLSACQTALPPELTEETVGLVVGDELQGLSQALFVAGAPSAVMTLWNVYDPSTAELMTGMYQELMAGQAKGQALQQAQLVLLRDERGLYNHPYYWSPFVLYGDWR